TRVTSLGVGLMGSCILAGKWQKKEEKGDKSDRSWCRVDGELYLSWKMADKRRKKGSEEAPSLLAGQTESLPPVASHEHEGFLDFVGS
nr:hypothetical protein [Tanacetum cinerariifolium]